MQGGEGRQHALPQSLDPCHRLITRSRDARDAQQDAALGRRTDLRLKLEHVALENVGACDYDSGTSLASHRCRCGRGAEPSGGSLRAACIQHGQERQLGESLGHPLGDHRAQGIELGDRRAVFERHHHDGRARSDIPGAMPSCQDRRPRNDTDRNPRHHPGRRPGALVVKDN